MLLLTPQQAFVDGDVATLENLGAKNFSAQILPYASAHLTAVDSKVKLGQTGAEFSATVPGSAAVVPIDAKQTKQAGEVAPLPAGFSPSGRPRVVAAAPTDAEWNRAAVWTIFPRPQQTQFTLAQHLGEKRFLRIKYAGDVMHLTAGGKLLGR